MKNIALLLLLILIYGCSNTQRITTSAVGQQYPTLGAAHIAVLSSDKMNGRLVGTEENELAAAYIEQQLEAIGAQPYFYNGSFKDSFTLGVIEAYNIVAEIKCPHNTDEYIILSAHFDHVYNPDDVSINDSIFNGANDNASGVAAVLEIGKMLIQNKNDLKKNVLLVLFNGEEVNYLGSNHLADKLKAAQFNLSYLINFEMIGKPLLNKPEQAFLTGFEMSNMYQQMNEALKREFIVYDPVEHQLDLFMRSDNYPFYLEFDVPAQTISTYSINDKFYHKPEDEFETLDLQHVEDIITLSGKAILTLLKENTTIEWNE